MPKSFKEYLAIIQEEKTHEDLSLFYVHVPCNVYEGKYYNYSSWNVKVEADSDKEALKIIKNPKTKKAILEYLNDVKQANGKRVIPLEDYKSGKIWPEKSHIAKKLNYEGSVKRYISKTGEYIKNR